jgi:hypothetical protein
VEGVAIHPKDQLPSSNISPQSTSSQAHPSVLCLALSLSLSQTLRCISYKASKEQHPPLKNTFLFFVIIMDFTACSHFGHCSVPMLMTIILLHFVPVTTMASSPFNPTQSIFMSAEIFPLTLGLGEFFTRIEVGTPPVSQYMAIHTGSDVTWFQCRPCNCDQSPGLGFDPLNSTSFSLVSCDSAACNHLHQRGCNNNSQCPYKVHYLDDSFTNGSLVLEMFTLGSTAVPNVLFGCGHSNYGLVPGTNGLLGLGGGPLSLPTQLRHRGFADVFSYCLPGLFGGSPGWLNFSLPGAVLPAGTAWIPLLRNPNTPTYYYVGLSGLGIGDMRLPLAKKASKSRKQASEE